MLCRYSWNCTRVEVIINAAEIVKNEENIQFVFVGDGPEKQDLINLTKSPVARIPTGFHHPAPR